MMPSPPRTTSMFNRSSKKSSPFSLNFRKNSKEAGSSATAASAARSPRRTASEGGYRQGRTRPDGGGLERKNEETIGLREKNIAFPSRTQQQVVRDEYRLVEKQVFSWLFNLHMSTLELLFSKYTQYGLCGTNIP